MIINKSSKERGFANAHLVTTKVFSFFSFFSKKINWLSTFLLVLPDFGSL